MTQTIRTTITAAQTATAATAYELELGPAQPREDRLELEADQDERQHVEHEDRDLPHRVALDAEPGRDEVGRRAATQDREDHHRDDAREVQPLGDHPDGERAEELDDHGGRDVGDARARARARPARAPRRARTLPTATASSIGTALQPPNVAGHRRAHREPVDEQRARVVEQALALEDHQDAVRRAELPEHRGRGRRVGRRDDGAERDRRRPRACRARASARRPPRRRR